MWMIFCILEVTVFFEQIIPKLKSSFNIGKISQLPLTFTGIKFEKINGIFSIHQEEFINRMEQTEMQCQEKGAPLQPEDISRLRGIAGQLQWIASQTRPDLSFGANTLTNDVANASIDRLIWANKLVKKAKYEKSVKLAFNPFQTKDNIGKNFWFFAIQMRHFKTCTMVVRRAAIFS